MKLFFLNLSKQTPSNLGRTTFALRFTLIIHTAFIFVFLSCKKDAIEIADAQAVAWKPFPLDTSSEWTYTSYHGDTPPNNYFIDTISFYFEGDTLMSRKTIYDYGDISSDYQSFTYHKLHFVYKSYIDEIPYVLHKELTGIRAYLRMDTAAARIYCAYSGSSEFSFLGSENEAVLYDFDMHNYNDTLPYNLWNFGSSSIHRAKNIGSITLNGVTLRTYDIHDKNGLFRGNIIEGIGALQGFLRALTWDGKLISFQNNSFSYQPE